MYISSNLAMSLDGKIATSQRKFFRLGERIDLQKMLEIRRKCDSILMGASTFKVYRKPCLGASGSPSPVNIILSTRLEGISPEWEFFKKKSLHRILITSETVSARRLKAFANSSEIVFLKKESSRFPLAIQIITELEKRGLQRLLIEGGGSVMWLFGRLNLIDQYHVTLTPKIVGGAHSPTLVDGQGFAIDDILRLRLVRCQKIKDELYLTYRKK